MIAVEHFEHFAHIRKSRQNHFIFVAIRQVLHHFRSNGVEPGGSVLNYLLEIIEMIIFSVYQVHYCVVWWIEAK